MLQSQLMQAQASILLLTYNGGKTLEQVLTQIKKQKGGSYELLAIDSSSTDNTQAILKKYGLPFEVIPQSKFNHGLTRNLIAAKARGEFLVYLTQDAIPADEYWLKSLLAPFQDSRVAGVYSRQINHDKDSGLWDEYFFQFVYQDKPRILTLDNWRGFSRTSILFSNAAGAVRKSVHAEIPFPRAMMSEDQLWAYEALRAGYVVCYEPNSKVYHTHHQTLPRHLKRNFDSGYSLQGFKFLPFWQLCLQFVQYYWGEIKFILSKGQGSKLPTILLRETSTVIFFALGLYGRFLPEFLVRRLSGLYNNR